MVFLSNEIRTIIYSITHLVYTNFPGNADTRTCTGSCNACAGRVNLSDGEGSIREQLAWHERSTDCTWLIQANADRVIIFEMVEINIWDTRNCSLANFYIEVRKIIILTQQNHFL